MAFENTAEIWSWNVNGANLVIQKNALQEFINEYKPQILCLNNTKIDSEKLDKIQLYNKVKKGYA